MSQDDDFKDAVLKSAITPDNMGKGIVVAFVFAFGVGGLVVANQRDIVEQKTLSNQNAMQISSLAAQQMALSLQLTEVTTEIKKDRELNEVMRESASEDRQRIESLINSVLLRVSR